MIEDGRAPSIPQWEGGATYDALWQKKEMAEVRVREGGRGKGGGREGGREGERDLWRLYLCYLDVHVAVLKSSR